MCATVPTPEQSKMNKNHHTDLTAFKFILRAQQLARQDQQSEQGYAMMMISILSIVLLSTLAAFMTMTNQSKSSTNAYVDGTNSFYVAESGLNRRADELRRKFEISNLPTGTDPATISSCFPLVIAAGTNTSTSDSNNDFECRNYRFRHASSSATLKSSNGSSEVTNTTDNVNYVAYTFVKPRQNYAVNPPTPSRVSTGQPFAGLNALEYQYTVYATAKKPTSVSVVASTASTAEIAANSKKVAGEAMSGAEEALAIAYDTKQAAADATNAASSANNSSTNTVLQMDFKSRVIPLFQFAAFYENDLEMDSQRLMNISGPVHTNGDLLAASYGFERATDATPSYVPNQLRANFQDSDLRFATKLMSKVTVRGSIYDRLTSTQETWRPTICASNNKGSGQTANCGVMAVYKGSDDKADKNNYFYFPDAITGRTTPLTPTEVAVFGDRMQDSSKAIPRLNPPKPGFLREKNYKTNETGLYYGKADLRLKFFPGREMPFDFTSIQDGSGCDLAANKIPIDRQRSNALTCLKLTKGQLRSLQQPVLATTSTTLSTNDLEILKALKVAIASADGTPLTLHDLNQPINITSNTLTGWQLTFRNLLSPANQTLLGTQKPSDIATARSSSFLPPPIQSIMAETAATNLNTNGGFHDQTKYKETDGSGNYVKGVWMKMLQTNIKSLTHWNRDGVYVDAINEDLTSAYTPATGITLSSGLSTSNKAFLRADATGLAAKDTGVNASEGGLVLYANVSDDQAAIVATASSNNGSIPGKDTQGNPITEIDYYRKYNGSSTRQNSPYGFVFSGGEELPASLTIATDQAAYIQGDYNNPGVTPGSLSSTTIYSPSDTSGSPGFLRKPAAIIADTITVLSNQCLNNNGRVNCGVTGTMPNVTSGIAINAAFLSNLMKSTGSGTKPYNGGINRFMSLLETWGGIPYNYTGSMVSLGEPIESFNADPTAANPPTRNFNYESRFDSFEKLPPLAPSAVYLQQDVFRRNY
jgi:hypothetical protein